MVAVAAGPKVDKVARAVPLLSLHPRVQSEDKEIHTLIICMTPVKMVATMATMAATAGPDLRPRVDQVDPIYLETTRWEKRAAGAGFLCL